jgi:hypothetical protein
MLITFLIECNVNQSHGAFARVQVPRLLLPFDSIDRKNSETEEG